MFKKSIIILIFILWLGLSNTLYWEYDVNNTSWITNDNSAQWVKPGEEDILKLENNSLEKSIKNYSNILDNYKKELKNNKCNNDKCKKLEDKINKLTIDKQKLANNKQKLLNIIKDKKKLEIKKIEEDKKNIKISNEEIWDYKNKIIANTNTICKDKNHSDECSKARIQQAKDFKWKIDFLTKQKEEELNKKIKDVQKEINDVQKNTDIAKIEAAQAVVENPVSTYKAKTIASKALVRDAQIAYNECKNKGWDCANQEKKLNDIKKIAETAKNNYLTKSKEAKNDITTSVFTINVGDISPWMNTHGGNLEENVNFVLGTIIQKLMIGLGSLSILIMTVGAWYIVLHNGQDELLNKWKSIFMSWIYAMIVALGSYYLIVIVRYLLYH